MDIAQYFEKIAVRINKHCLVSASKQLTVFLVAPVETLGIDTVDMTHTTGEIAIRSMDQQMVMIWHQAIRRYFKIPSIRRLLKNLDEGFIVMSVQKNVLPSSATIHDMIPGSGIFYA